MKLPVIQFDQLDDPIQQANLDAACRNGGFFALENHGVSLESQSEFLAIMSQYFSQPTQAKRQQERTADNPFGFYDKELTKNKLDLKEIFDISLAPSESTKWPGDEDFIAITSQWHKTCHEIAMTLLGAIFQCLQRSQSATDAKPSLTSPEEHFSQHTSFLRLNFYPKYIDSDERAGDKNEPSDVAFGVSHHTDAGALTILCQDQVEGLQFYVDEQWHTAPANPQQLLVNIGDMLQVWSNDTYQAPLHRVLTNAGSDRYSAPYFLNPNNASDVRPLIASQALYRAVNWGTYRHGRSSGDYTDLGHEVQISDYRTA